MGRVDLHDLEAGLQRAPGRRLERRHDAADLVCGQCGWGVPAIREWQRTCRDRLPGALVWGERRAALPRPMTLALRPAWASWIAGTAPWLLMKRAAPAQA